MGEAEAAKSAAPLLANYPVAQSATAARFKAFISYRHVAPDQTDAKWLQSKLETYRVPKHLVLAHGMPPTLGRMFRDEEELAASPNLSASIEDALRASDYLIVVCSPSSAASQWVNAEIKFFRKLGRDDRILTLLIEGDPLEAFPPALYEIRPAPQAVDAVSLTELAEPLAADVRPLAGESKQRRRRVALIRIAAALLGCRFDDLWRRDQERYLRRMTSLLILAIVSVAVLAGLSGLAIFQRNKALSSEREAFSRELAANAALLQDEDPELRLRLAFAALGVAPTEQAEVSFRRALIVYHDSHLRTVFEGHNRSVRWATFDSTGNYVATASEDGSAALWGRSGGRPLRSFASGVYKSGYPAIVYQANFSPDGRLLVTASQDGRMRVYRTDTGELTFERPRATDDAKESAALRSAFFSHDGRRILTASEDRTVAIWDANTGDKLLELDGAREHEDILYSAVFSPDDSLVATASRDGTIRVLDARSGALIHKLFTEEHRSFRSGVFSPPYGSLLLGVGESTSAPLWEVVNWERAGKVTGHSALVRWAAFSNDGKLIATASGDHKTRIYDVRDALLWHHFIKYEFASHRASVNSVQFSPDGRFVLTSSADKTARIWVIEPGIHTTPPLEHSGSVRSVTFSSDGKRAATASEDGTAAIWDAHNGEQLFQLGPQANQSRGWITSVDFSRDGKFLATAGTDKIARIWNSQNGLLLRELHGHTAWVYSAVFSPDGSLLATVSRDGTAMIWSATDGRHLISCNGHRGRVTGVAFSQTGDGSRFATVGEDGSAKIWSWNEFGCNAVLSIDTHHRWAYSVALSRDGSRMVTAGEDGVVRIWDTRSGAMLNELKGHQGWIYRVAWNDNHIISAGEDGTARIWDPDTGKRISTIPASPGWWVYSAEISGGRVALASEDGKVFIYGDEFLSPISELMSVEQQLRKLSELERRTYLHEFASNTR